jgi:multiple sugar transport system permease protein
MIKKPVSFGKLFRQTIFYLFISFLAMVILLPIFFLVTLSFMSTREAYDFPLPTVPALNVEYSMTHGKRGYLLSVYDKNEGDFQTVLDTKDLEKMSEYMRYQLGAPMEIPQIQEQVNLLESGTDPVEFTGRRNLWLNYGTFFRVTRDAVPAFFRSLQICAMTIAISLVIGGMAGYAFARYNFAGRDTLKFSILFVRIFPGVAIAMPMVIFLARIGFYDRPIGLSLVYSIGAIALTIWITASIFLGIPVSLEEAAVVFGATKFRAFLRITLPLAVPGLAAAAMYTFIGAWTETVSAIILTQFNPTFSVVVYQSLLGSVGNINLAAAGGLVMALPSVLFTFFIRRYINQMWGGVTI